MRMEQDIEDLRIIESGNLYKIWKVLYKRTRIGDCLGLCSVFGFNFAFSEYFKSWEHYSGIVAYPVPSGGRASSSEAFAKANSHLFTTVWFMYGWHSYGNKRRHLAGHIANCMEKEL